MEGLKTVQGNRDTNLSYKET